MSFLSMIAFTEDYDQLLTIPPKYNHKMNRNFVLPQQVTVSIVTVATSTGTNCLQANPSIQLATQNAAAAWYECANDWLSSMGASKNRCCVQ
jgi:hypothetical protein